MCGIFGAIGPLPEGALAAVSSALAHRGPDAAGEFVEADVSLLHRRLKIIDLSAAALQPMPNEDGSVLVVFNGEIYNHHALRDQLVALGHQFRSLSDTEVIVHGYESWGDGVVERLDGMFAFGLWDRMRRILLLARDRVGKKPIFWSQSGGTFRFASTVAALHASGLPQAIDVSALPQYLVHGFVPAPFHLHAQVRQLPPASRLVLEAAGEPRIDTYWEPRFGAPPDRAESFRTAAVRVRELVTNAVERRLEADVPLGAFLSGGIDSTIVVGLMARLTGTRVRTFSIGFAEDARYDETAYARLAAEEFGTDHTEFTLPPSSFDLLESLVSHHDGPFGDSSAIPTWVVSQLTRRHVTVALTGDGGDELFCGYQRFLAAELADRIPGSFRGAASALAGRLRAPRERSLSGKALRFLRALGLPLAERMARWNSYFPDAVSLLGADVRRQLGDGVFAPAHWQQEMFARCHGSSTLSRVLEHNLRTYLPYDLLVKADRCSMAHGLETRSPFLDTALIEYAQTLPPHYLRRGWQTKRILKHAFRDLIPPAIMRRGKMGFAVPLGTWFRGPLADKLNDYLGAQARLNQYLDAAQVALLLAEHREGRADHGQRLWLLLTLEVWLRQQARAPAAACAA